MGLNTPVGSLFNHQIKTKMKRFILILAIAAVGVAAIVLSNNKAGVQASPAVTSLDSSLAMVHPAPAVSSLRADTGGKAQQP
jgi:hypothetical protein